MEKAYQITIRRKIQLMDFYESVRMTVNGRFAGSIAAGETRTFRFNKLPSELKANIYISSSNPLYVEENTGEDEVYELKNRISNLQFLIGLAAIIAGKLIINYYHYQVVGYLLIGIPALYFIYCRFIDKQNYLRLIKEY